MTLCRNLRLTVPPETSAWVLNSWHPSGGFLPFPGAPMPDLLSTADPETARDLANTLMLNQGFEELTKKSLLARFIKR